MADVERPVMVVTAVAMATIKQERAVVEKKKRKKMNTFLCLWEKKQQQKKCSTVNSFQSHLPNAEREM